MFSIEICDMTEYSILSYFIPYNFTRTFLAIAVHAKCQGSDFCTSGVLEAISSALSLLKNANNNADRNAYDPNSTDLFGPTLRQSIKDATELNRDMNTVTNSYNPPGISL